MSETLAIIVEREMPYPADKIWRALTQPQLIEDWLMKNDFKPTPGHRFSMQADWGGVTCQVRTIEPHKTLSYSWDTKDLRSVVTWTLTATDAGTIVRMEQVGFQPHQQSYYRGATVAWPRFIDALQQIAARAG